MFCLMVVRYQTQTHRGAPRFLTNNAPQNEGVIYRYGVTSGTGAAT